MKQINILLTILYVCFSGLFFSACEDDKYREELDLFQPRFVLDEPKVEGNSIALVWYKVNDATSYTVELHLDNFYNSLFAAYNTTDPQLFIDDIPYATRYYIRLKSVASDSLHNSHWTYTNALTESRPAFANLLERVAKADIMETSVTIRWQIDPENPVDSIGVVPAMGADTIPSVTRFLTSEEIGQGYAEIDGLERNTLYNVNIYDTSKPRKYDKPYNTVNFRTAGPSAETIIISRDDDLSAILSAANNNTDVPEGTEYYLPAGSYFKVSPFTIKKGFKLTGSTDGERVQIELTGSWNTESDVYISSLEFENIEFFQTIDAGYFFNSGNAWNMEQVIFFNCTFKHFKRGFWRHQGSDKLKRIGRLEMENCMLDECGGHTGPYGTFSINSGGADNIENAIFTNCTFMRDHYQTDDVTRNMRHLFDYGSSAYPINLEYRNITIYDYAYNQRLINIAAAENSTLVFEKVLVAAACGNIYSLAAKTTTSFADNYVTADYLVGPASINATELGISANNLFVNPTAGDLTIKDANSPIVTNRVGDTRWLP
ncbi:hypothetical protein GGR21_000122 [Dysgonomonas hofstadii]|uniref:DUF5123 domain-containing protein n=1 Tax=Dysgonomonas hofstadii TaxID=637886 RepID=A0A840CE30_9BACT|nr:DUF5123 domain-containing protein [Dysgonomonas hofstadii]MBB4034237.1 hypothetical protein [Dysgonomonas hofstadii]